MDFTRRFIFRGNAAAISGRIVRPNDVLIDSGVASSLTVAGGLSTARAPAKRFGDWVGFGAAETSAEGIFDDLKQHIERSYHRVREDALTTSTRVHAEVTSLVIEGTPRLTVRRLHAALTSTSPLGSGEPAIAVGNETAIDGVEIGGYGLIVELLVPLFQKYNTRSKLLAAADDPHFVKESGDCLFMKASFGGAPAPPQGRLLHSCGTTYATIVKSIRWAGEPYPGATIDHNLVTVPDFGQMFFGELLVTDLSRRLTLLRLQLGSPVGGSVAVPEVESNGTWSN
jgi:hypothetical protein